MTAESFAPEPLDGVTVVDWTGGLGAYAGRLLADLGADVIRVVPPAGDPVRDIPPMVGSVSMFERFVNLNKRLISLDPSTVEDKAAFLRLLASVDVLIHSHTRDALAELGLNDLPAVNPRLVQVSVRPFGATGPYEDFLADDLIQLAAGGLLGLGGYQDTEPIAVAGRQSDLSTSIMAAAAALLALLGQRRDGQARKVDVSAQEVVAGALEDAVPEFDLTGRVRRRRGETPREAGTGTFPCRDGYVAMVAGRLGTAKAWTALAAWLGESGVDELSEECWTDFKFRQSPAAIGRFQEVFGAFAGQYTKAELYQEAQRRRIALAPVNDVADLRADPQLLARSFFVQVDDPVLGPVVYPGRASIVDGNTALVRRPAPAGVA